MPNHQKFINALARGADMATAWEQASQPTGVITCRVETASIAFRLCRTLAPARDAHADRATAALRANVDGDLACVLGLGAVEQNGLCQAVYLFFAPHQLHKLADIFRAFVPHLRATGVRKIQFPTDLVRSGELRYLAAVRAMVRERDQFIYYVR